MKILNRRFLFIGIIAMLVIFSAGIALADVILYPGYISGTFQMGDFITKSANVSASGGGYSASKSISGGDYVLTVQGGDWNYSINASTYVGPTTAYYPRTYVVFNPRTFSVPEGQTVTNDYSFNAGVVRFNVHITGDPYNSWSCNGYAVRNVSVPGERTYSTSSTSSYYSPNGVWEMPVVPNDNIRIYAYVYVDGKYYYFWTSSGDYRYENIGPGEVLEVDLNVNHVVTPPPPPPPPPTYEYGTVRGTVNLNLLYPDSFTRHYVYGYGGTNVYANPGDYILSHERANYTRTYRVRTYFDDNHGYLYWPYTDGEPGNDQVYVSPNQTQYLNFDSDSGVLTGEMKFTGTLTNDELNYYRLYAFGASQFYVPGTGWVRQNTYGGQAYMLKYGTDPDITYRLQLTPGPWLPYKVNGTSSGYINGYYNSFSFNINDYRHYYDGNSYNYGQPSWVQAGDVLVQDREYCMGSVVVRFRDDTGGLLSSPSLNGAANIYNEDNQRIMQVSISGSSSTSRVLTPEVELHAPTGLYTLSNLRITAEDGSRISFPSIPMTFECAVRKVVTSAGVPVITISNPPANLITNVDSILVVGTAADGEGISSVTVNGNPAAFISTGNPDNEVSFSYDLVLADGKNTITAVVSDPLDRTSSDERDIYVDRWIPTVTITKPDDGAVYLPGETVPVLVQASDQGYGFTLKVYVDGTLLCETDGDADDAAPVSVACGGNILSTVDDQDITAEAVDLAGNSASAIVTIHGNTPPTVEAGGPYTVYEGGSVSITAAGDDPENGPLSYAWDLDGDGTYETAGQSVDIQAVDGPSSHTVSVQVTDNGGLTATDQATINVLNAAPVVGEISAPGEQVEVGTAIDTSASFTDAGVLDTHTAEWDWGDGTTLAGTMAETDGSGTAGGTHVYAEAGIYTVTLTVTDKDGDSGQSVYQSVIVYDPRAGFVTGGGWIASPAGAYYQSETEPGAKANFGFVAKYKKGSAVPVGNIEFNLNSAGLKFHSSEFQWMVVTGSQAILMGSGTINGKGNYGCLVAASDGSPDTIRIKLWDRTTGQVVYDSQRGASDDASPASVVKGGSIVIHSK